MKAEKKVHYTLSEVLAMENRQKINLINALSGFKSVALIGSVDTENRINLAIFNSFVHVGSNPPCIGFISRPDIEERHTVPNILETSYYTINHISEETYLKAHQTSARYSKDTSEFDAVALTPEFISGFPAPFVKESSIQIGLQFREQVPIKINGTILIIGEIQHVSFPENCLCEDGFLDIEKAGSLTCSGLDSYHRTKRIQRLSYAKPFESLKEIPLDYKI
jgi:flavin reductase (DIM6/NTAB) family NADH-FMN oxidoreductase RutF